MQITLNLISIHDPYFPYEKTVELTDFREYVKVEVFQLKWIECVFTLILPRVRTAILQSQSTPLEMEAVHSRSVGNVP